MAELDKKYKEKWEEREKVYSNKAWDERDASDLAREKIEDERDAFNLAA